MPTDYDTSVLELDGKDGENDEVLDLLRHFQMDETSGTQCTDYSGNAAHGTYVLAPTLAAAGPLMRDANGGGAVTFDGTTQYVTAGAATAFYDAYNNEGLTMICWYKSTAAVNRDMFCGASNISDIERLIFGRNSTGIGGTAVNQFGMQALKDATPLRYGHTYVPVDTRVSDGRWHMVVMYAKLAATMKFWFDRVLQLTPTEHANGTVTALTAGTNVWMLAARGVGTAIPDSPHDGTLSRMTFIRGELTQVQINSLYRSACYLASDLIPVRHAYYDMASSCSSAADGSTPCVQGDICRRLNDLSGNANHLVVASDDNAPTFLNASNWNRPALDFQNLYQGGDATTQEAMVKTDALAMLPAHCCVIAVVRVLATSKRFRAYQPIGGIYNNATPGVPFSVVGIRSERAPDDTGPINGADRICHISNGANGYPTAAQTDYPSCRCLPGLAVVAINVGGDGVQVTRPIPKLFMNRWSSVANGIIASATVSTGIRLGGDGVATTDLLFMGRVEKFIITTAIPTESEAAELDAFAAAEFAASDESMNPPNHIAISWSSTGQGEHGTLNRNAFAYFPAIAKRHCSFANAAIQAAHISNGGAGVLDMDERGFATAGRWNDPSATNNIFINGAGGNDINDGTPDTAAQAYAEYVALHDAITARFNKFMVLSIAEYFGAAGVAADYNALASQDAGDDSDRFVQFPPLTPYLYDSIHVNDEGHEIMGDAIWGETAAHGGTGLLSLLEEVDPTNFPTPAEITGARVQRITRIRRLSRLG